MLAGAVSVSAGGTVGGGSVVELDRIVAIVNSDVITRTELDAQLESVSEQLRQQRIATPPQGVLEKQVLERMMLERLQLQLAENSGIRVDDETLNQTLSNIAAQNNLSLSEFRDVLQRDGYDFARFREDMRKEIILRRLHQRHVDSRVSVTEQEIDNFLATRKRQGGGSEEYRLRHILVAVPEAATPEQIGKADDRAQALRGQLEAGADFEQVAIASSDGQQALSGGDLGWRKASELPTLFAELVPQMEVGALSEVIRSPSGFHIVKLVGRRAAERHVVTQTRVRHILIEPSALTTDDRAREQLREIRGRIGTGEDFAELAAEYSDDAATAADGGSLGWIEPGDMVPSFESAVDGLEPGEVSQPVKTEFGWHLIQVLDRREHDNTEEFTRDRAREAIYQRKVEEERMDWVRRLRDEAYVEYRL